MESGEGNVVWWRIGEYEIRGSAERVVGDGSWRGAGALDWQLVHRRPSPPRLGGSYEPAHFELSCFAIEAIGGFQERFPTLSDAFARAEELDSRARSRSEYLGASGSQCVVLWPDDWVIVGSSEEIGCQWSCPVCGTDRPAYKVEIDESKLPGWMCSSCSMPLEWRESPDRFRLTEIELDRLVAKDLEWEWDLGVTAVEEGQFYVDSAVALPAVQSLRHVWLPTYLTKRAVLCCEEDSDGDFRWVIFINDGTRVAILLEASEQQHSYIGYFVEFGSLGRMLDTIETWDSNSSWANQLPDPRVFWLRDNQVSAASGADEDSIRQVLFSGGNEPK